MKALVGAFNQEKALVGAFSVIIQPVVEPMDRFTALVGIQKTGEPFIENFLCRADCPVFRPRIAGSGPKCPLTSDNNKLDYKHFSAPTLILVNVNSEQFPCQNQLG